MKKNEARDEILAELFKKDVDGRNENAYRQVVLLLDDLKKSNPKIFSIRFSLNQLTRALRTNSETWEEEIDRAIQPEEF